MLYQNPPFFIFCTSVLATGGVCAAMSNVSGNSGMRLQLMLMGQLSATNGA